MYVVPEKNDFVNGMFKIRVSDGYSIILNIVDEYFEHGGRKIVVKCINVAAEVIRDNSIGQLACPNVIGLSNFILAIIADDPALYGKPITEDNLGSWGMVIGE
jgi:hypothetical protein